MCGTIQDLLGPAGGGVVWGSAESWRAQPSLDDNRGSREAKGRTLER